MEPDLFRSKTELKPPGLILKMFVYSGLTNSCPKQHFPGLSYAQNYVFLNLNSLFFPQIKLVVSCPLFSAYKEHLFSLPFAMIFYRWEDSSYELL